MAAEDAGTGAAAGDCTSGVQEALTWEANCERRILRQLMMAATKVWLGERCGVEAQDGGGKP